MYNSTTIIGAVIGVDITKNEVESHLLTKGYESVRLVGPDTVVTMDFVPARANVEYDENNVIKNIKAG